MTFKTEVFMKIKRTLLNLTMLVMTTVLLSSGFSYAQDSGKRPMQIKDYALFRSITGATYSNDGNWFVYGLRTPQADDTLHVKNLSTDSVSLVPMGTNVKLSDDSKWAAYFIQTSYKESEKLKKDKKPVPKKIQLMNLETGEKHTWKNGASFEFSKGSGFLAVKKTKADTKAKYAGTDMILRNLSDATEELFGSTNQFKFNKPGAYLAYTVDAADKDGNGVFQVELNTGARKVLDNDTLTYAQLNWEEEGAGLGVLKGIKNKGNKQKDNILLAFTGYTNGNVTKTVLDPKSIKDFTQDMVISEFGNITFSDDLSKVFFGIKEQEVEPEKKKDAKPVANVDLFHWQDDRIQTAQAKQANRDKKFTYRSVVNLKNNKFIQLADKTMKFISITENGEWGIGSDEREYISDWKPDLADYYRVNTSTGERTMFLKGHLRTLGLSPDSKNFIYWKDKNVWNYDIKKNKSKNITEHAPVSFVNAEYDRFGEKPPYGVAGWSKDGKSVILNGKYDLYQQSINDGEAVNLTNGAGEKDEVRLRYVRLDREEKTIDLKKPLLLSAFGQWTKKSGYYEHSKGKTKSLIYQDKRIRSISKSKNSDNYVYTIEDFENFSNYYTSNTKFDSPKMITDANKVQNEFTWGKRILFEYKNKDGVRLQGTLAIPNSYKQGDKFPMLVQFYEKYSQNLNNYYRPVFRDTPQFAKYVSQGYLVMQPDIHFNLRTTHEDMLDCVTAATKKIIELGYADPNKIGMHGHSFSGGGSSFIATQTRMFKAIASGAAPIDLAAEFNILFHSSGQNNHSYDIYGQGRYATNPFDDFELYRQQSPITHAKTMDTPLLYLHGMEDGSVEYLQGMEWYNALRFLGKPVIFASYPGSDHHLKKLENQIDYQTKMEEFFAHHLLGKPAPEWMTKGVPFLKKKFKK